MGKVRKDVQHQVSNNFGVGTVRKMSNSKLFDIALKASSQTDFKERVSALDIAGMSQYELEALIHKSKELSTDDALEMKPVFKEHKARPSQFEVPKKSKAARTRMVKINLVWLLCFISFAIITKLFSK